MDKFHKLGEKNITPTSNNYLMGISLVFLLSWLEQDMFNCNLFTCVMRALVQVSQAVILFPTYDQVRAGLKGRGRQRGLLLQAPLFQEDHPPLLKNIEILIILVKQPGRKGLRETPPSPLTLELTPSKSSPGLDKGLEVDWKKFSRITQ